MNYYKADTIKAGVKISRYLADRGIPIHGKRAVATWRDGKRDSVSIDDEKGVWHDFTSEESGDIIALCGKVEGGDFLSICRTLGDRYHLTPDRVSKKPPKVTHGEMLIRDGYALVKSYEYQNEDGTPRYWVDRYERTDAKTGQREKSFDQRGPNADNLAGIKRTLYHLPLVKTAQVIHLCEGEKDADTLVNLGLAATTNSGGAKNWQTDFGELFDGKDVIVQLDNDEAGQARRDIVVNSVAQYAKSVRVLTISKLPKGDVTDWFEKEGGTLSALMEAIDAAPLANADPKDIADAKEANGEPLVNFTEEERTTPSGKRRTERIPRGIDEMCAEMATRFLGFPKVLGTQLFDFTRAAKFSDRKIVTLDTDHDLRAWIDGTSRHQSEFQTGCAFVTYHTLMSRLRQTRPHYDVVANAPWFPARADAFSAFEQLPTPDAAHSKFNELMAFFSPATPADATLIRAFFMSPMFYNGCERPAWIVDSTDGQGAGKSKVVEKCCRLYNESPLSFDFQTLQMDGNKIIRELLSAEGRGKRLVLFDNVTTSFKNGTLARLITQNTISGMRPFGHGTETRNNDITWTATSNGATLDTDAAVRFYVIKVKKPTNRDVMWEKRIDAFIDENRGEIHAEMMDLMRRAPMRMRKDSRFGEFDSVVLSAACETDAEFEAADVKIVEASAEANDDADLAAQFVEAMNDAIFGTKDLLKSSQNVSQIQPKMPIAIRCTDVDNILRRTNGAIRNWTSKAVRRHVNSGNIRHILKGVERLWTASATRYFGSSRCFIFSPDPELLRDVKECQFVEFEGAAMRVLGVGNVA